MSTQVETKMFWSDKVPKFHGEVQNLSPKEMRLIRSDLLTFIEQAQGTESSKAYVIFRPSNGGQFSIFNKASALGQFVRMIKRNYPVKPLNTQKRGSCAWSSSGEGNYGSRGQWIR